ncbi:CAAX prenyl protease-related protein [Geobacter sp. FeAm09]|nr:CAAX prenyl protease-related protein [Geobacter sp. FeAm09]
MAFIGLDELLRLGADKGVVHLAETSLYYLYPVKALTVAVLLYRYRKEYTEISLKDLANVPVTLAACGVGLLVFALWIRMDWALGASGAPKGFDPGLLPGRGLQLAMTAFRVGGAVLVVPIMEELFWRSFLIRYIIDTHFADVPLGRFTWGSFLATVLLFGFEHHFVFAGMMAGAIYNVLLYRTRSLAQCILSHAVTNLALAIYVIYSGTWYFW